MQELGESTARQPAKLANGNIPYHGHHVQSRNGGWPGSERLSALLIFHEFESSLVQEFKLFHKFSEIRDCRFP